MKHIVAGGLLLTLLLGAPPVPALQSADGKPISAATEDRLHFVEQLLTVSSAARRVKASGDPDVKTLYRAARELYQRAVKAMEDGDRDAAGEALFYSTETMFRAVRLTRADGQAEKGSGKAERDVQARLSSVEALMKALERIGQEKGRADLVREVRSATETALATAQAQMESNQPYSARKTLDAAYVQIKAAISQLRSGDTLVRSLHFESKRDEYLYELDRNDTHKMLVQLLLEEKLQDPKARKRVQKYLDRAVALRAEAEKLAEEGDYAGAVTRLEESTTQYVRAIRNSGFYIPG